MIRPLSEPKTTDQPVGVSDRYGAVLLLSLAGLVLMPVLDQSAPGRLALLLFFSALLLLVYRVSHVRRAARRVLAVLLGISLVIALVAWLSPLDITSTDRGLGLLLTAFVAASPYVVARRLLEHERISSATLAGALSLYLLIGILFAMVYSSVAAVTGEAFFAQQDAATATDYLYFSFVTMTTVGFGDLSPAYPLGKSLAATQGLLGQIYLVSVVALIVSNLGKHRRRALGRAIEEADEEAGEGTDEPTDR